jgi:hypothetical protein
MFGNNLFNWDQGRSAVFLTEPLTSTDFDGDSFSTENKTKIDLSDKFGVPAEVKAILAFVSIRDSGSSGGFAFFALSPNDTNGSYPGTIKIVDIPNDTRNAASFIVPCDNNGDVYYQCNASGTDTLDVWIEIWGYWR